MEGEKTDHLMRVEYSGKGTHRIVAPDANEFGDWVGYLSLAYLTLDGRTFVAGSEYGLLPKADTVYELTEVSKK